jgi:hypothetical protein
MEASAVQARDCAPEGTDDGRATVRRGYGRAVPTLFLGGVLALYAAIGLAIFQLVTSLL